MYSPVIGKPAHSINHSSIHTSTINGGKHDTAWGDHLRAIPCGQWWRRPFSRFAVSKCELTANPSEALARANNAAGD